MLQFVRAFFVMDHGVDDSLLIGTGSRNFPAQAVVEYVNPDRFNHRAPLHGVFDVFEFLGNLLPVHIGKLLGQEPVVFTSC